MNTGWDIVVREAGYGGGGQTQGTAEDISPYLRFSAAGPVALQLPVVVVVVKVVFVLDKNHTQVASPTSLPPHVYPLLLPSLMTSGHQASSSTKQD